jgi:MATE family multidrug resistance protein
VGRGDGAGIRRAALTSICLGAGIMATFGVALVAAPNFFAALFTNQPGVLELAALLIPIAGVFQVFDGLQGVAVGVLRGMADTRVPMLIIVMGFWLVGLPIGWLLGFVLDLGPAGLWWGLVAGLGTVATCLLLRVRLMLRRDIGRVHLD